MTDNWYSRYYKEKYQNEFNTQINNPKNPDIKHPLIKSQSKEISANKILSSSEGINFKKDLLKINNETINPEIKNPLKDIKSDINYNLIILFTLIIILIILGGIYFFTQNSPNLKYFPIDIEIPNGTADSVIYYNSKPFFTISGWETKLDYNNYSDRLFGNEQYKKIIFDENGKAYTYINLDNELKLELLKTDPKELTRIGWFAKPIEVFSSEKMSLFSKNIQINLNSTKDIVKSAQIKHYLYKNKPYFKSEFNVETINNDKLNKLTYGIVILGDDIYLPDGNILENDNKIVKLNNSVKITMAKEDNKSLNISSKLLEVLKKETDVNRNGIERLGSTYQYNSKYQIFVNKEKTNGIIIYSPNSTLYKDSFFWNVYWIDLMHINSSLYPTIYFIILSNPELNYDKNKKDFIIKSDNFNGEANNIIEEVIKKIS